jgi:hypothetical protein
LVGFSPETLTSVLISSVVLWITIPWVLFDVYANSLEGRSEDLFARIRGTRWRGWLVAAISVLIATRLSRGYWALVFWMLAGASTSYCFSQMLFSAYDRGRNADKEGQ